MIEQHITVERTARYWLSGAPTEATRSVWFLLHGYGQLAREFLSEFADVGDASRLLVAPEGLSRYYRRGATGREVGATWMTREDRLNEIRDYIDYLDKVYAEVRKGVDGGELTAGVLGFSQGVATACRWAAMGRSHLDRLILWAGQVPPDLELTEYGDRLSALSPVLVLGDGDQYAGETELAAEQVRLKTAGVRHRVVRFSGGHRIDLPTLRPLLGV